jgi:hypothetical protein
MTQCVDMPKPLGEGRSWHPIEDKLVEAYSLYVPYTMPEGYSTIKQRATLSRIWGEPGWTLTTTPRWPFVMTSQMKLPPSEDPPFQLAEALYDAAK